MQVYRNLLTDNRTEYFSSIFYFFMLLLKLNIQYFFNFFEMGILKGLQGSHNAYIYNPTFLDLCQHMTMLYKFPS